MRRPIIIDLHQPTVDVVIPCYNHGRFLAEAVESALGQSYPQVRVIVVDDGSTDDTPHVASRFGENIRYLRKTNGGLSSARNAGIDAADGDFIVFLDADDYLHRDAIRQYVEAANRHPAAAVIYANYAYVNEAREETSRDEPMDLGEDAIHSLMSGLVPPVHAMLLRRSALVEAGGFDTSIRFHEDLDLWMRIAAAGHRFAKVDFLGAYYRKHAGTMTGQTLDMADWGLVVLRGTKRYHHSCPVCVELLPRMLGEWKRSYAAAIRRAIMTASPGKSRSRQIADALRHLVCNPSLIPYLVIGLSKRVVNLVTSSRRTSLERGATLQGRPSP